MIDEIIEKYEQFNDALILEFGYQRTEDSREMVVTIRCMNKLRDYEYEIIKLYFAGIVAVRYIEKGWDNSCINTAFISNQNGIITFDFSPTYQNDGVVENEDSEFSIKCKEVRYTPVF